LAADEHVLWLHGQLLARAHCKTARWPFLAADEHVLWLHGQLLARAHCKTARWPFLAADEHVPSSQGQPLARSHCSTSSRPYSAAAWHANTLNGIPFSHAHIASGTVWTAAAYDVFSLAHLLPRVRHDERIPRQRRHTMDKTNCHSSPAASRIISSSSVAICLFISINGIEYFAMFARIGSNWQSVSIEINNINGK